MMKKKKILVYALSGIGDALMFTPALQLMRKHLPVYQIDALVMFGGVKNIYDRTNLFDKVIHFDFLQQGAVKSILFLSRLIGKYDYTINVYPSNRKEYNIISLLSFAKKRAGVKYLRKDFSNLGFLNSVRIKEDDLLHNVQENLNLVKNIFDIKSNEEPDLLFPLNDEDEKFASEYLIKNNFAEDDLLIGIHAGCATLKNHIKRRWEPEKFAALALKLKRELNAKILLFGGHEEEGLKLSISNQAGNDNVFIPAAKNLSQSAALIKRCSVIVTNDSSLMHVSAALKRNVVAIIGPTNINYIYPWHTKHEIVSLNLDCSPCFFYSPKPLTCSREDIQFKCIKELDVDRVYNAVKKILVNS